MNWKYSIIFFIYIIVAYCEYVDYAVEELAALILAAGNEDGTIAREIDPETYTYNSSNNETNYELRPILIDVSNVGNNGNLMDIQHIIPSLRGLEGEELNKKFHELYELATRVFNTFMDPDTEVQDRPANINTYDGLRDLIISKDKNESIGLCNNDVKTRILFVPNDSAISMMKIFIYNFENDDIDGIDMNDFDKLPENIKSEWKKEKFSLPSEELSKVIAMKCIKTWACKKIFYIDESSDVDILKYLDEISFNIVETTDSNNHLHYSVMIINNYTGQIFYVFTLTYDGDKYSDDKRFPPKYSYYDDISYNVGGYHITFDKENNSINREGINLIAACGTIFVTEENGKQIILKPKDYILKDQNGKIKTDDLNGNLLEANFANAESLKSFGENEENIICDRYDISYATIKMISKRFIDKRLNNIYIDGLTDDQLLDLNAIYQLMAIKDVFIDPLNYGQNGMLHYTKNNKLEYISQMSDFEESRYLASYTQSKLNLELKSGSTGLTNFATPVTSYDLEGATSTANDIIDKYTKNYSKRNLKKRDKEQALLVLGWIDKADIFEKIYLEEIDIKEDDSKEFLASFHEALKELNNRHTYDLVDEIKTYNELKKDSGQSSIQNISVLVTYFYKCLRLHINKFGHESLLDSNGRYVFRNMPNINIEASKNTNVLFNLYEEALERIVDLIDDIYVSNLEDTSKRYGVDHSLDKSKRNELSETFEINENYILNELLLIDYNDLPMESRIENLIIDIHNILTSIEIHNNDEKNKPINGSKFFSDLHNSLMIIYKLMYSQDIEVQGLREPQRDYGTDNKLILNRVVGRIDEEVLNDYIINNINSKYYLSRIFNHMKIELSSIAYSNEDLEINEITINQVKSLQDKINDKLNLFNEYTTPSGHEEEGEHLLEVINNYNELVLYLYYTGTINSENKEISTIDTYDFIEKMKYIFTKNLIDSMEKISIMYPDLFNINSSENSEKTFYGELNSNGNVATYYEFIKDVSIIEPSAEDYSKILGEKFEYKSEAINMIINKIEPEQCFELEKALALRKNIFRCENTLDRNQDEIDEYESLYNNLVSKSYNRIVSTKNYESFEYSRYRHFINFLRTLQNFDSHIVLDDPRNGDDGNFDYSSIYVDDNGDPILNSESVFFDTISRNLEMYRNQYENENNNNDQMEKRNFYNSTNSVKYKRMLNGFITYDVAVNNVPTVPNNELMRRIQRNQVQSERSQGIFISRAQPRRAPVANIYVPYMGTGAVTMQADVASNNINGAQISSSFYGSQEKITVINGAKNSLNLWTMRERPRKYSQNRNNNNQNTIANNIQKNHPQNGKNVQRKASSRNMNPKLSRPPRSQGLPNQGKNISIPTRNQSLANQRKSNKN
ncbi:hypothetical protein BCR32DRAFT_242550 [Anaeromyces robustus]|uniref:Uncharacterized protein n=1 Tax=Anaeromyces robustus TaxID=1754192 RepID=A0A1Y1XFK6_9FUNG|nr:hypothetical protein BCR32DRAFT_242550 [Anaeromyces robustus]|eukprot:ORX84503.1 hypothetical protein BCR32DRAFT_242550 [Anaeromyces robustus]